MSKVYIIFKAHGILTIFLLDFLDLAEYGYNFFEGYWLKSKIFTKISTIFSLRFLLCTYYTSNLKMIVEKLPTFINYQCSIKKLIYT